MLFVLLAPMQTASHEVRPAHLKLSQVNEQGWMAAFMQPQSSGRFLNLGVETNCTASAGTPVVGAAAMQVSFQLDCSGGPLARVRIEGIERTLTDAMVTVETLDGETRNYLITPGRPEITLSVDEKLPAYLVLGVEHLIYGLDHVLFVLTLMYLVHGWKNLVRVITSFTLAHSITLGLSAFDVIRVSQPPVEALIAFSILLLAMEALRTQESALGRRPWLVAFAFGLLHGLGFAAALAEIGLPDSSAVTALFLFNVGIELGQLAIIAVALLLVAALNRAGLDARPQLKPAPLYLIGGLSCYWFMDRSLQILL